MTPDFAWAVHMPGSHFVTYKTGNAITVGQDACATLLTPRRPRQRQTQWCKCGRVRPTRPTVEVQTA